MTVISKNHAIMRCFIKIMHFIILSFQTNVVSKHIQKMPSYGS